MVRATNRYKKETNEYYARTPIILIIPFSRRLQFYILLVDLGQEPAPASVMPQCQGDRFGRGVGVSYSWSLKRWYSSSPTLTGLPPYYIIISKHPLLVRPEISTGGALTCGIKTRSPGFTEISILLPSLSNPPGPTARTLASDSFSTVDSGRKIPEAVLTSALIRWTRMRSRRGARDLMERREVACSGGSQFARL